MNLTYSFTEHIYQILYYQNHFLKTRDSFFNKTQEQGKVNTIYSIMNNIVKNIGQTLKSNKRLPLCSMQLLYLSNGISIRTYSDFIIDSQSDPAPRGGIPGPCPPKRKLCPPKRGLCPEEINRLGLLECKWMPKTPKLVLTAAIFVDSHREFVKIFGKFWKFEEKKQEFVEIFVLKTFFCWSSFSFDPHSNKLYVPPCPVRIHINKLLVPPKIYFCPPQSRYPGAGSVASGVVCLLLFKA